MYAVSNDPLTRTFRSEQADSLLNPMMGQPQGEEPSFLNSDLYKEWANRPTNDAVRELYIMQLNKRLWKLGEIYEKKLSGKADYFDGIDLENVRRLAQLTAVFIFLTNPEKFTVDFTEDASVVFTLVYPEGKTAYLELYFKPGDQQPDQLVVLISENKKNVFAYSGGFIESLNAFLKEMSKVPN